jgi:hypothetical protein
MLREIERPSKLREVLECADPPCTLHSQAFVPPRTQRPSPTSRSSTGPRRVTPATLSGTVRPHPASLSTSDPTSQPHVTVINRSAARYTCYAQRNGPGSVSSITCPLCLGARARDANVSVT